MIKIDKNVPIPPDRLSRGRKYPWDELEVGDSFFVEGKKFEPLRVSAAQIGKAKARKFIARQVDGGVRVWRVE